MDAARPLVSVVMPSLDQGGYIEAAARSVLQQDYAPLELVVADGGSTDGTLARLEALAREFGARLRWTSGKDSGAANAVNKALAAARGDIIGWLNSDDLYAPTAVSTAVAHFRAHPATVMVYGEADHIDAHGKRLGRYPTRPPSASLEGFRQGCFICQPTAFLRREVFDEVGYLDESLRTAFDFDLWMRVFRRFPQGIARIADVQAYSRLHDDCLTVRLRRVVAVEGVKVLARHVGRPRPQWLLNYVEEMLASYPAGAEGIDLRAHVDELVEELRSLFDEDALKLLRHKLAADARLALAIPGVFAGVYSDGWAPPLLRLRVAGAAARGKSSLRLQCRLAGPAAPISLAIKPSWREAFQRSIEAPGAFEVEITLPPHAAGDLDVLIESRGTFVPRAMDPASSDGRELAFRVERLQLHAK